MTGELTALTFLSAAALYPAWMSLVADEPQLNAGFFRFGYGLSAVLAIVGFASFLVSQPLHRGIAPVAVWGILLVGAAATASLRSPRPWHGRLLAAFGILAIARASAFNDRLAATELAFSFLNSGIVSGALFSMILGHWYLNVVNLPIALLRRAVLRWSIIVALGAARDLALIGFGSVTGPGEFTQESTLLSFDGLSLLAGVTFLTALPAILGVMIWKTVKIRSTQSATGLLYVVTLSTVMGDLLYRFALLTARVSL